MTVRESRSFASVGALHYYFDDVTFAAYCMAVTSVDPFLVEAQVGASLISLYTPLEFFYFEYMIPFQTFSSPDSLVQFSVPASRGAASDQGLFQINRILFDKCFWSTLFLTAVKFQPLGYVKFMCRVLVMDASVSFVPHIGSGRTVAVQWAVDLLVGEMVFFGGQIGTFVMDLNGIDGVDFSHHQIR